MIEVEFDSHPHYMGAIVLQDNENKTFTVIDGQPTLNKEAADKNFEEKKAIYSNTQYKITQEINQNEWNPQMLKGRQAKLAKIASVLFACTQRSGYEPYGALWSVSLRIQFWVYCKSF